MPASSSGARVDRRAFTAGSLAALAGARVPRLRRPAAELRVAVVGLNGIGLRHAEALARMPDVRVAALCDVDDVVLTKAARRLRDTAPGAVTDVELERVLRIEDLDAVVLATPNHWHALQAVLACRAGKHVFLETPATHVMREGEALLAAAAEAGRVVRCAFPARLDAGIAEALAWLRAGELGALRLVRALAFVARSPVGNVKGKQRIPDTIDYDRWCGPAPLLPVERTRLHHDWRWLFPFGDGALGDRAVHALDLARRVLGPETLPASVLALGLRAGPPDDGETPDTLVVHHAYEPAPLLVEVRGLPRDTAAQEGEWAAAMDEHLGVRLGVVAHCEAGTLRLHVAGGASAHDLDGVELRRFEGGASSPADVALASFVQACLEGPDVEPVGDLRAGVHASALVHLGNASYRVGARRSREDVVTASAGTAEQPTPELAEAVQRMLAHLDANDVDLEPSRIVLGPRLEPEPDGRRFRESTPANGLLEARYRAPWALPPV